MRRCLNLGGYLERIESHLEIVAKAVSETTYEPGHHFPWRTLSGAINAMREGAIKVSQLKPAFRELQRATEKLRNLIYKRPGQKELIHRRYMEIRDGLWKIKLAALELCPDPE